MAHYRHSNRPDEVAVKIHFFARTANTPFSAGFAAGDRP
jgi:hypothetical protein